MSQTNSTVDWWRFYSDRKKRNPGSEFEPLNPRNIKHVERLTLLPNEGQRWLAGDTELIEEVRKVASELLAAGARKVEVLRQGFPGPIETIG